MLIIAWEVTAACNLRCDYCRASAVRSPQIGELSTAEALSFIDEVTPLKPMIIFSGGEPLLREDVFTLCSHATRKGIRVSLATNGTLISNQIVDKMADSGVVRVSISLDGADPLTNDITRGDGSFSSALKGIEFLKGRVPFQINMTITKRNSDQIDALVKLAEKLGAVAVHLFFMVPTGRGRDEELIGATEQDELLRHISRIETPLQLQVTCAPQYARILAKEPVPGRRSSGCMAGRSFVFVSRVGDVYPCGYLPITAGNIRVQSFAQIWNDSPILLSLRNREYTGRCKGCTYNDICGGCRARAYSMSSDYLGDDPLCGM